MRIKGKRPTKYITLSLTQYEAESLHKAGKQVLQSMALFDLTPLLRGIKKIEKGLSHEI